ncbi:MAG: isoprenylcysteine carboxylmethyltransferase family protein [Acidobacteriota bacterium]|nr:isoprenylcysteine carboxylmethyltransferase family protein [Acidobacteriota bacterium]
MTRPPDVATPSPDVTPVAVAPWVIRVARLRVTAGFAVAAAAFWLARPSWGALGLGAAIGLAGEGLRCWAAGHLEKAVEVTNSGPYRWTRHPLYVGSALLGVGFAIASRHPAVAALVVGYLAGSLTVAARLEEATLRAKFGDAYDRYIRGNLSPVGRRFSLSRARRNGEVQALVGLAAALVVLALKVVAR